MLNDQHGKPLAVGDVVICTVYEKGEMVRKSAVVQALHPDNAHGNLEVSVLAEQLVPILVHVTAGETERVVKGPAPR